MSGRSKVPLVGAIFWIIKILTTAMGESLSDWLVRVLVPEVAVATTFVVLAGALALQFQAREYVPWRYWFAVSMVAVFGTMAADVAHVLIGVPYAVTAVLLAVALVAIFVVWHRLEGTVSIHSITTRRRECFYWATVMVTFALGTAVGDLTAVVFGWGFFVSGMVFLALFLVPAIGYAMFGLNAVVAFWTAYVLTRPLGASFADWLAADSSRGGADWGFGSVAVGLIAMIVIAVTYVSLSGIDRPGAEGEESATPEHDPDPRSESATT